MPVLVGTDPLVDEGFPTDVLTQAFLGDSGIVLGDTDAFGCRWKWGPSNAWGNKPGPREQTGDREYGHGQWDGSLYYNARTMALPGWVTAPTHAALHAAEQRLRNAVGVKPFLYRVIEPGFDGYVMARQSGELIWTEDGTPATPHASFNIGLYAKDPLVYSNRERTFDLDFPSIVGGRTRPRTLPGSINATTVTGFADLFNPSPEDVGGASLQLRIDGPAQTATIAYPELGLGLYLDDPDGGPILTAGQWLDVDTGNHLVLLNGDASRRSWAYGDWLLVPPDATTTVAIAGTGTTAGVSHVSGAYRAARL